jgi:hypothetical protein
MALIQGSEQYGIGSTGSDALTFLKSFGTDVVKGAVGAAAAAVGRKVAPADKPAGGGMQPPPSSGIPMPLLIGGGALLGVALLSLFRKR